MPRTARRVSKTGIYHVMLRGINRQVIFEEDADAERFLLTLKNYKEKDNAYKVFAYCLMSNHIHLLLKEEKEDLGLIMRRIGASYVYWYNWKYDRCGHLFQDRYKSEAVEDVRYFLTVIRYIHQNPLKGGLVKDLATYRWSSYSEFTKQATEIVDTDFVLDLINKDRDKALASFKSFHLEENDDACLDIEEVKRVTDDVAGEIIKRICAVRNCTDIQVMEKGKRNECLRVLKAEGLSTRQIERLTGISRGVILRA